MNCHITYLDSAMVMLEIGSLRLLTDPVFDPAGTHYISQPGEILLQKLADPVVSPEALGAIDVVILSHDQHEDNLDHKGRAFLPQARCVITTVSGAYRLGGNALGLHSWQSIELEGMQGERLRITATPARHGPSDMQSIVGDVTGFVLEWKEQHNGVLYISGDTIWFPELAEIGERFRVNAAILHMGMGGFDKSGPIQFSMNGKDAIQLAHTVNARTIIPCHYEGWAHFRESPGTARQAFASAGMIDQVLWLPAGVRSELQI